MELARKMGVSVLLLAIIIAGIALIWKSVRKGAPRRPDYVMDYEIEKIDEKTLQVLVLKAREWEDLGERNGKYKNPNTGEYTMVPTMRCDSCGGTIPMHEIYADRALQTHENLVKAYNEYMCPLCGEHALPPPPPAPPSPGPQHQAGRPPG